MNDEEWRSELGRLYRLVDPPLKYPRSLTRLAEEIAVEPFRFRAARKRLERRQLARDGVG